MKYDNNFLRKLCTWHYLGEAKLNSFKTCITKLDKKLNIDNFVLCITLMTDMIN